MKDHKPTRTTVYIAKNLWKITAVITVLAFVLAGV
ncbi:coil containing protein [Vibrio phage 1.123.O._10N.286.48.F3]|nr:coil containing protein [Vibrio phage 1.123.O._10N.286.48.F3]